MIPKNYKEITVEQYQKVYPLIKGETTLEMWLEVISILLGKSYEYVESLPLKELQPMLKRVKFLKTDIKAKKAKKYLRVGHKLFKAETEASNLNTGQYTSIKTFMTDSIENLHLIAACTYKERNWLKFKYSSDNHKENSELFKKASMQDVYPVVFFCSLALIDLMKATEVYLESQKIISERITEMAQLASEMALENIGDGMQPLTS